MEREGNKLWREINKYCFHIACYRWNKRPKHAGFKEAYVENNRFHIRPLTKESKIRRMQRTTDCFQEEVDRGFCHALEVFMEFYSRCCQKKVSFEQAPFWVWYACIIIVGISKCTHHYHSSCAKKIFHQRFSCINSYSGWLKVLLASPPCSVFQTMKASLFK